jgi:OOP family OmpA-OmpF porin
MFKAGLVTVVAFIMVFVPIGTAFGQATDAENCKDHPMFSRMKNFAIVECKSNFDAAEFFVPGGTKTVEGQKTTISYALNEGAQMPSAELRSSTKTAS